MSRFHILAGLLLLSSGPTPLLGASGEIDSSVISAERLAIARERSQMESKYMLVAFLGEGWSVSCKKLKAKVLETEAFKAFADKHLIYFPVEARRKPKLSSEETAVLQSWVILFDIASYPTVMLVAPDGEELLRHGYRDLSGEAYVNLLKQLLPDTQP